MIRFEDAKAKAKALKPGINACTEFTNAYMFYDKSEPDSEGGTTPCVIMKDTGEAISGTAFYTSIMAGKFEAEELETFDLEDGIQIREIIYVEPAEYFPKELREKYFGKDE